MTKTVKLDERVWRGMKARAGQVGSTLQGAVEHACQVWLEGGEETGAAVGDGRGAEPGPAGPRRAPGRRRGARAAPAAPPETGIPEQAAVILGKMAFPKPGWK